MKKNQINSHQQKDLSPSKEKEQDSKEKNRARQQRQGKKTYFCKSKKHGDKICPDILEKNTRGKKRECDGEPDIPKKKRKLSKIL